MSDDALKPAHSFFETHYQELQSLFAKVKLLDQLNEKVAAILEPHLRKYCQVANVVENRLILLTANGSIATQIRFQMPELLRQFKHDPMLAGIQYIHCKVNAMAANTGRKEPAPRKVAPLSQETAAIVSDMAKSMDDPKLREVMERIASHAKKETA